MATLTSNGNSHTAFDAQELHRQAHAVVQASCDHDGWWGAPMETALVAVADAQHPDSARFMAEKALESVLRWVEEDEPRSLGDDAAAVALAARAARELHRASSALTAKASELVTSAFTRKTHLAALHVALVAWALDPLIPQRGQEPWETILDALPRLTRQGLNEALVLFVETLAIPGTSDFPSRLADVPVSGLYEHCVHLWLLTEVIAQQIARGSDDEVLAPFMQRRAELLEYLLVELAGENLVPREAPDYDPFVSLDTEELGGLHLFEAAMLDRALGGDRNSQLLITLSEAGRREEKRAHRRQEIYAVVTAAVALVLAGLIAGIEVLAGFNTHLWVGSGMTVLIVGLCLGLWLLRDIETKWNLELLLAGVGLEILLALAILAEGAFGHHFFAADIAIIIGIACLGVPLIFQAGAGRLLRQHRENSRQK